MTEFGAVHDGERGRDSPIMTRALKVCRKCGAEILAGAPEALCTACLFETGLNLLAVPSVGADDDCGSVENVEGRDANAASHTQQKQPRCQ